MSTENGAAWQQLTLDCSADVAAQVSSLLDLAEPAAVSFPEASSGRQTVQALFPAAQPLNGLIDMLCRVGDCRWQLDSVPDQDWLAVSQASWSPQELGSGVWVGPGWCERPADARLYLNIDPGQAFGTGQHPTTRLCLQWLVEQAGSLPANVIDYGCGSGVLAIAAAKLGARRVIATDIDPLSLTATADNAMDNGVPDQVVVISPSELTDQPVELLLANILLRPLIALAPRLSALVADGGHIVLSGIMQEQVEHCREQYERWFDFETPRFDGEWAMLAGVRRAEGA